MHIPPDSVCRQQVSTAELPRAPLVFSYSGTIIKYAHSLCFWRQQGSKRAWWLLTAISLTNEHVSMTLWGTIHTAPRHVRNRKRHLLRYSAFVRKMKTPFARVCQKDLVMKLCKFVTLNGCDGYHAEDAERYLIIFAAVNQQAPTIS